MKNYKSIFILSHTLIIITLIIRFAFEGTIVHLSSINVTGSAKRDFTADIIVWQSNFSTKNMVLSIIGPKYNEEEIYSLLK